MKLQELITASNFIARPHQSGAIIVEAPIGTEHRKLLFQLADYVVTSCTGHDMVWLSPRQQPMEDLPMAEYWARLIAHGKTEAPALTNLLDANPEKWTDCVQRLRDLCAKNCVPSDQQFNVILANIGSTLQK
jgi:hypothetical protein